MSYLRRKKGLNFKPRKDQQKIKQRNKKILIYTIAVVLVIGIISGIFYVHKNSERKKQEESTTSTHTNKLSETTSEAIKTGMKYKEIANLIGTDGDKIFQTVIDNQSVERYSWNLKDSKETILLTFTDNILTSINRTYIEKDKDKPASITSKTIDKINPDISYSETADVIGVDGKLISETAIDGITSSIYTWHGKDSTLTVTYINNKAQSVDFHQK